MNPQNVKYINCSGAQSNPQSNRGIYKKSNIHRYEHRR